MDSLLARSAILITAAGGMAFAQMDSVSAPSTDSSKAVVPAPVVAVPVVDTMVKALVAPDTAPAVAPVAPIPPAADSAKVVVPVAPAPVVDSPVVAAAADAPKSCARHGSWVVEAGVRYGWAIGDLLDQEERLTKRFNVVLTDDNKDTSDVDPISTGVAYRATAWYKLGCGAQFGIGFQYGLFSEHPASSYAPSLTEDFLRQMLLTARFRHSHRLIDRLDLFGEVAGGWNKSTIERAPLVAAHLEDGTLRLSSAERALAKAVHSEADLDGVHGDVAVGIAYEVAPKWSVGLSAEYGIGQLWLGSRTSTDVELGYPESLGYMGFGFGVFVSRGF